MPQLTLYQLGEEVLELFLGGCEGKVASKDLLVVVLGLVTGWTLLATGSTMPWLGSDILKKGSRV